MLRHTIVMCWGLATLLEGAGLAFDISFDAGSGKVL